MARKVAHKRLVKRSRRSVSGTYRTTAKNDATASERVVRVADITRIAEAAFGERDAAARWLSTPNLALGNATPLSMLDTEPGAIEVRRILSAINHGGVF